MAWDEFLLIYKARKNSSLSFQHKLSHVLGPLFDNCPRLGMWVEEVVEDAWLVLGVNNCKEPPTAFLAGGATETLAGLDGFRDLACHSSTACCVQQLAPPSLHSLLPPLTVTTAEADVRIVDDWPLLWLLVPYTLGGSAWWETSVNFADETPDIWCDGVEMRLLDGQEAWAASRTGVVVVQEVVCTLETSSPAHSSFRGLSFVVIVNSAEIAGRLLLRVMFFMPAGVVLPAETLEPCGMC